MREQACVFTCEKRRLYGILSLPLETPRRHGVLIVVGGEQYRAGSHRQFTLLAWRLAAASYPVLRFDFGGLGDSEGEPRLFDARGAELTAAIDALLDAIPALDGVVLWGLCDGASAALLHAAQDRRVVGLALLNPWVSDSRVEARATLKVYYRKRLFDPDFWRKLRKGHFRPALAWRSLVGQLRQALRPSIAAPQEAASATERMRQSWAAFDGPILLMLSENDLTAQAFAELGRSHPGWSDLLQRSPVTRHRLAHADHTCSRPEWQAELEHISLAWLARHFPASGDSKHGERLNHE